MAENLCAKGVLAAERVNKSIDLYAHIPQKTEQLELTAEQQAAYDALAPHLADGQPHTALLYGVTGSGKTLVFLKLIEQCLALGKKALVLVPEISLTPQMIRRLKERFGRRVAVQHSALNHTERLLQWQMIQDGGADIVVGTRSAVFAPLEGHRPHRHRRGTGTHLPLRVGAALFGPRGGPLAGRLTTGRCCCWPGATPQHRELL